MTLEQVLPWITGSGGALAVLAWVVWKFQGGQWVAKERLDEMRAQRDAALTRMDKALDNADSTARAIEERNRVEAARLDAARRTSLSGQMADEETNTRRRTRA